MIALLSAALGGLWRRALPWLALITAILLFAVSAKRSGEKAGRAALRLEQAERTSHARQKMLEAAAHRPRDRADLVERLRKGGF